ncbi:putative GPI-anchored protein 43 [Spathaspora sp. JA1]|nr:putative GPI-anchored protein 43 [Spathaspora sp. JA1]
MNKFNNLTKFLLCLLLVCFPLVVAAVSTSSLNEYGTYVNPNPRPVNKCDANDLIKLSGCCNDVLKKLDECKADDLACECCALQSIEQECYHLCPGNPSTNFLTVLLNDCVELSEINACSLPFKKDDDSIPKINKKKKNKSVDDAEDSTAVLSIKSRVQAKSDEEEHKKTDSSSLHSVEEPFRNKKIKLVLNEEIEEEEEHEENVELLPQTVNVSNITVNLSGSDVEYSGASYPHLEDAWLFFGLFIYFFLILD